jgi:lysophospholipase L1-like esterase
MSDITASTLDITTLTIGGGQPALVLPFIAEPDAVFSDDFARSDSAAGGVGNSWVDSGAKWKIASGKMEAVGDAFGADLIARPTGENIANPRVSAVVSYASDGIGNSSALVWVRADAASANGYAAWLGTSGGPVIAIAEMTGGSPSFTTEAAPISAGNEYILTIQANGTAISATVATTEAPNEILASIGLTDATYATGQVAVSPLSVGQVVSSLDIADFSTAALLVCDGNSLTAGHGLTTSESYPAQLSALIGAGWDTRNVGVSAQTTQDMQSDAVAQIDALYSGSRLKNVLVAWEITNDLYFGASAGDALTHFKDYCADRRVAGFTVVAVTVLPRSEGGTPGGFEASRATVNAELRNLANMGVYWDAVFDLAADGRLGDAGDEQDLTYYLNDDVHINAAGCEILASGLARTRLGTVTV